MRYTTRIIVPPRVRRSGPPGSPGGAYGPQVLGIRKTFGFGDRLGVATPGHIAAAAAHLEFAPIFAQQSARELLLTGRSLTEVVGSAARAVSAARFRQPWGANADRLQTAQLVADAAEAGYTAFTLDPAEFVRSGVQAFNATELQAAVDALVADGDLPEHWAEPYLDRTIDLPGNHQLRVTLEPLQRAVVRYAPAIVHCARLASAVTRSNQGRPFEIEVALDTAESPTTTLEHLFIGLELEARGVRLSSLALTHGAVSSDGGDGAGREAFERQLSEHAAVAEFCGPYKLCFDEAVSPDTSVYPLIGRICGDALHVKTSAVSYLEALRVVARVEPTLFEEIARHMVSSATAAAANRGEDASHFLDGAGREQMEAACPSVLTTGQDAAGRPFKQAVLEILERHGDMYTEALVECFEQRMTLLNAG